MNFKEEILKSIQGMVDKYITNYKSDHTYQSVIKNITKNGYIVLDETGQERMVKCCIPGVELKVGASVLIKIPNGDLKQIHIVGISGNTTATTTATKIGSSTVGNAKRPIFLNNGIATACNATVGNAKKPVYMSEGTFIACDATVGGTANPVYSNSGVLTACNSTVGKSSVPVYMNKGTITACSSSMITYSITEPLNMNSGTTWIDA